MKPFVGMFFFVFILYLPSSSFSPQIETDRNYLKTNSMESHIDFINRFKRFSAQFYRTLSEVDPVKQKDPYYFAEGIGCTENNCDPSRGKCNKGTCECIRGFANIVTENKAQAVEGKYCSYTQKRQLTAFLLEFFLSFGIGHLYTERWIIGVFKLFLISLTCGFFSVLKFLNKGVHIEDQSKASFTILTFASFMLCTFAVWQLVDIVLFGINYFPDGKGIPLKALW